MSKRYGSIASSSYRVEIYSSTLYYLNPVDLGYLFLPVSSTLQLYRIQYVEESVDSMPNIRSTFQPEGASLTPFLL